MSAQNYVISDASKMLEIEPHVLRNWEFELKLKIQRNELGHRYYTKENIETLKMVKNLKEHGFTLKHIKLLMPSLSRVNILPTNELIKLRDKLCLTYSSLPDTIPYISRKNSLKNNINKSNIINKPISTIHPIETTMPKNDTYSPKLEQLKKLIYDIMFQLFKDNKELILKEFTASLTTNIAKELNYQLLLHEANEEEHFKAIESKLVSPKKHLIR